MAPKKAPTYVQKRNSKFVAPSQHLLDEDTETEYILLTTKISPNATRTTRNRAQQVSSDEVRRRPDTTRVEPPPRLMSRIDEVTIHKFLYCPSHTLPINTIEYDYWMGIIQSGAFQRDAEQKETLLLWLSSHIADDGECIKWVQTPSLGIRKATLSFSMKFFLLLVRNRLSQTQADNVVTWDQVLMIATILAGLEIDFARILIEEIHEKAFKTTTTLPFPFLD
uniref:Integrase core domain containing protein n=1 Tax=Solanum tuberosum TaxID=4113 RepID=M1DW71_SOLTU